jgi:uncharacterized BrkB/YihY/UPF0761 family membrane protein
VKRLARGITFLAVLGTGLVLSTALAAFGTFGRHDVLLGLFGEVLAVVVNVGEYVLAFRVLTPRSVHTRDLIPGAVVGGVAWTLLLALGGYLIGHDLRNDSAVYGLFGMVLGLLAWVYLGAEISIYAAEVNTVLSRSLWPRAMVQPPSRMQMSVPWRSRPPRISDAPSSTSWSRSPTPRKSKSLALSQRMGTSC